MRSILIVLFTLLVSVATGAAEKPANDWWQKGNEHYRVKQYDSAATYYEKIAATQPEQPEVFYNLGNAYYRLNNIGRAVLNYQRALRLDPGYTLAEDNLYLTENRISNRIQPIPELSIVKWWRGFTRSSHAAALSIVALFLFLLLLAAIWCRTAPIMRPQLIGGIFGVWLFFLIAAFLAAGNKTSHKKAVVMKEETPLLADPSQIKVQSYIPEGTTLKIEAEKANFVKVVLPDGRAGWMESAMVERI